jgi:hypothetical protein
MKRLFLTLALVAAAAWPLSALAGEGYRCTNACPLAKRANQLRATGAESARVAETVRHEVAKTVADNLRRI